MDAVHALVNWHLGAAIYTLPYYFSLHGSTNSLLALLACAVLTIHVYSLLDRSSKQLNTWNLGTLIRVGISPAAATLFSPLVILNVVGVVSTYFVVMYELLPFEWLAALLVLAFAISCARHAYEVSWANLLANSACIVLIFALFLHPPDTTDIVEPIEVRYELVKMGTTFIFLFSSAEVFLTLHQTGMTKLYLMKIGTASVIVSALLYGLTGVLGAKTGFRGDDILTLFLGRKDLLSKFVLLSNSVSLALSLPVFVITARKNLYEVRHGTSEPPNRDISAIAFDGFAIIAVSLKLRYFIPHLVDIIGMLSGLTDSLFMLVAPQLIALRVLPRMNPLEKALCVVEIACGAVAFAVEGYDFAFAVVQKGDLFL